LIHLYFCAYAHDKEKAKLHADDIYKKKSNEIIFSHVYK